MTNIFDVAAEAGVSHQTVSRVLNGDKNVRPTTKARVEDAIAKLNYRPSAAARALAGRRARSLGLISTGGPLFGPSSIMQGFDVAARLAGYQVSTATLGQSEPGAMRIAVDALLGQNVEAIVLIAPDAAAIEAIQAVDVQVPLVVADSGDYEGFLGVSLDQFGGAVAATEHLVSLGHRSIVHLAGPASWTDARAREEGWRSVVSRLGSPVPHVLRGDWTPDSGYRVGLELADRDDFTAVFCGNDQMALGVLHAFVEKGVDVPGRISVIGFDDIPEAAHFHPPLTTMRQDFEGLGRDLMRAVEAVIRGDDPTVGDPGQRVPDLIVRSSTRSLAD
ncbi:substrate-binding domain-containing protein [Frondihabitans cladoniiphilus]|uniref:LacI family DNA-binding transcriptional regulator n=1 Tax=Frondihabitans cladoniiphilus TaxID=715785 RepID=A0ABP8VIG0_9MICO